MKVKYSGKASGFKTGSGEIISIVADLNTQSVEIIHGEDGFGEYTDIMVDGCGIAVEKGTLVTETVE